MNNKLFNLIALCICLVTFASCSKDDEELMRKQAIQNDTDFPIIVDQDFTSKTVVVDGKTITITRGKNANTRAINGDEVIYPRDPNATLATTPIRVLEGKYKKYSKKSFSPFAELQGATYVLLRLSRYEFECKAPANAKQSSFDITNITKQGFATESASYKGYSIDKILVTTTGVIYKCSFYIQEGIAYNIIGQALNRNTPYPLAGENVRYQFTYQLR